MRRKEPETPPRLGVADFQCNVCKKVVKRDLGWKVWHPSFCSKTGKRARLYRISAPTKPDAEP